MPVFKLKQCVLKTGLFFFVVITGFFIFGCGSAQEDSFLFCQEETGQGAEGAKAAVPPVDNETGVSSQTEEADIVETDPAVSYVIHICGAVRNPGVYELPEGSRIMDAVRAGGGFLPEADPSACNLAARIADGCQIYIMTQEESSLAAQGPPEAGIRTENTGMSTAGSGGQAVDEGKVNLNTADAETLKTLPGIGDSRAAAIIAWREENGRFDRIEDIMKVSGIKQAAFEKIKENIRV